MARESLLGGDAPYLELGSDDGRDAPSVAHGRSWLHPPLDESTAGPSRQAGRETLLEQGGYVGEADDDLDGMYVLTGGRRLPSRSSTFRWPPAAQMDAFLMHVYAYYQNKGLYCIIVNWTTNSLIWMFTTGFSTFLLTCIDYNALFVTYSLAEAINLDGLRHMNVFLAMCLAFFCLYWVWHTLSFFVRLRSEIKMYHFFNGTLNIPDRDMQTIEWNEVVRLLLLVQPTTQVARRLDEFELASRILRRDNYLTGLLNHDILHLELGVGRFTTGPLFTKYMEWCLKLTLLGRLFDDQNQLDKRFLAPERREALAKDLRRRFLLTGIFGLFFAPFMIFILLATFLFKYGEEIHRDPRALGARLFSPYARFQLREFNEYPHQFDRRLAQATTKADEYISQFPSEKLASLARLVAFVAGAFAVMLAFISIVDEDALLRLEITPGRTVLWYLGITSATFALARAMIPEESRAVFRPVELMREIAEHTHYMPERWLRALHADLVRREFSDLYQYRLITFGAELLGIVTVPLILIFGLRSSAAAIVDFVREASVSTERSGVVCCFATTHVEAYGDARYGASRRAAVAAANANPSDPVRPSRPFVARHGKMERSLLTFIGNNPSWQAPAELNAYVEYLKKERENVVLAQSMLSKSGVHRSNLTSSLPGSSSKSAIEMSDMHHSETDEMNRSLASSTLQQMQGSEGLLHSQPGTVLGIMELLDRIYAAQMQI